MLHLIKSKASALGRAVETKRSWGNATSLVSSPVRRMHSLPPSSTAASIPAFQGHMLSAAGSQTAGICQELHLAHGIEKDRGAAVVCGTNVEECALIRNVPGQRSHGSALKLDGEHDGWHVSSTAENSF